MYRFFRPFLFRLDPEAAHQLTLQALRFAGSFPLSEWFLRQLYKAPSKPVQVFGFTFRNPVGLAAGYDKDAAAVKGLSALGFGHVELGTVTLRPQPGYPRPRVFRLLEDKAVINRMGFPSKGADFVVNRLKRLNAQTLKRAGIVLGINLGKNKDTPNEEAVQDYLRLLKCFAPYADYLAVNVSSPNTPALRELQRRAALEEFLKQLQAQRKIEEESLQKRIPLLVKLAPDLSENEIDDAVDVILSTHMDGIIATNTTLAREGLVSEHRVESGGLSGSPLRARSEAVLRQIVQRANEKIPIVSAGGIITPEDAARRLELGATLIQLYTGLIYSGPGLVRKTLLAQ